MQPFMDSFGDVKTVRLFGWLLTISVLATTIAAGLFIIIMIGYLGPTSPEAEVGYLLYDTPEVEIGIPNSNATETILSD